MREKIKELISAWEAICLSIHCRQCEHYGEGAECAENMLADHLIKNGVVIPVRCGECKRYEAVEYWHPDGGGTKNVCRLLKRQMQTDDFCSYGEKREE